jgi:hypothetical protein
VLTDCYWNEVITSVSTKWPSGFDAPKPRDPLGEIELASILYPWRGGLCTPGILETKPTEFVASGRKQFVGEEEKPGRINDEMQFRLFSRLALQLFRLSRIFGDEDESILSSPNELDDYEISVDEFEFTSAVIVLFALGIRFERVIDSETVEVVMHPISEITEFVDSDAFRMFRLFLECEIGRDIEGESTLREAIDGDFMCEMLPFNVLPEGSQLDFSKVLNNSNSGVSIVSGSGTTMTPIDAILRAIFLVHSFVAVSTICPDSESNSGDAEDEPEEGEDADVVDGELDKFGGAQSGDHLKLLFGALGVESAEWSGGGFLTARLRPPMDLVQLLIDLDWYEERSDGPNEEELLRLAVANPDLKSFKALILT